jgi:uncharacterized protein YkwD
VLPRAILLSLILCLCAQNAFAQDAGLDDPQTYNAAQDYMLYLINQERSRAGLSSLRIDFAASEAGLRHADEMLAGGYSSHWDFAGLKPTRRFNLLGGFHSVDENLYYSHSSLSDYRELVDEAMAAFMASEGHRRAILGPGHTHVGLAFAQRGRDFYVCQEFTTQIGGEYRCPLYAEPGDTVEFSGRFDPGRFDFEMIILSWEELPERRSVLWLSKTAEYSEGQTHFAGYVAKRTLSFDEFPTCYDILLDAKTGHFRCDALLDHEGREGMYYITLWLTDRRAKQLVHAATATVEVRR